MAEIAVLGAGGLTGQKCVEKLLEQHKSVKAVVRDPSKYKSLWSDRDNLTVQAGDVTDAASLEAVLSGAKGVIFAVSSTSYLGADAVDHKVDILFHGCTNFDRLL